MQRPIIDFGRLNLPIKAKFHKKSCGRIPCSCWAKIEAWQIHKLWRSLELRICNFLKNYLTTSTICMSERTAFVVFLEKSKVRIPLLFSNICKFLLVIFSTFKRQLKWEIRLDLKIWLLPQLFCFKFFFDLTSVRTENANFWTILLQF